MQLTNEETFDYLRKKVAAKIPFCLLRYGDGEGLFAFAGMKGLHYKYLHACEKHWGEMPRGIYRLQIMKNIRQSFRKCDLPGLPYDYNGFMWRMALNNFLKLHDKPVSCMHNIHIALEKEKVLDELMQNNPVFYIGCRDVDQAILDRGAKSVDSIRISAQYKFETEKPKLPFYKQVKHIEAEVKKKDLHGVLCLLAVGVAGKQLGIMMKERGGMVIDVGSVFDMWVGKRTRGWIPEIKVCETEKINTNEPETVDATGTN